MLYTGFIGEITSTWLEMAPFSYGVPVIYCGENPGDLEMLEPACMLLAEHAFQSVAWRATKQTLVLTSANSLGPFYRHGVSVVRVSSLVNPYPGAKKYVDVSLWSSISLWNSPCIWAITLFYHQPNFTFFR